MFHTAKVDYEKSIAMTPLQTAEKPYVSVKANSSATK